MIRHARKVIAAFPATGRVLVEGVSRIKKHVAGSASQRGASSGGIVTQKDGPRGMDITVVTTATNNEEGRALLKHLGFPFKEN